MCWASSQDAITVRHAHGAGCYGHNGADDVAVDAAVIAMQIPDHCIRVQWRREEEFGFEPLGTAMHVTLRAALDDAGKPVDWTAEIWSPTHVQRPSSGGNLLTHEALPTPPPEPRPTDPPEANGGGGTRNAFPLYDFPAKRVVHHLVLRAPVRTSALRGLGALPNVFAIECFIDELAERAGVDPVEYRLSMLSDPRARRLIENVARTLQLAGARVRRQRTRRWAWAGRATRTARPMPPSRWRWRSTRRCGCAASGAPPMRAW